MLGAQETGTTNFKNVLKTSSLFSFYLFLVCLYSNFLCLTQLSASKASGGKLGRREGKSGCGVFRGFPRITLGELGTIRT